MDHMNPSEEKDRYTWQSQSQDPPGPSGVRQGSKSIEEWLGQIQYGAGALPSPPRRFAFAAPALLLLLGLGAGAAGGWFWAMRGLQPPAQETAAPLPQETGVPPEAVMAERDGWQLVWKGEVLQTDAPTLPSNPPEVAPPLPPPRERTRPRGPGGAVTKGYLGVRGKTYQQAGVEGVKILEVFPDSPAAKAGLRSDSDPDPHREGNAGEATGHIIVAANGQAVRSEEDLAKMMNLSAPGDVMQVVVMTADGSLREAIIVVLDEIPRPSSSVN
jgi:PDZ domain